jgi:nucleoside-diphosphate-sugar epimerase
MKKVLVIGSTGAMGRYLVPFLAKKGYLVTALSLDDEKPYNENVVCVKGNAKDKEFLTNVLKEKFDGIVDFMIYHNYDFPDFYKLYLENTNHYIFLSSCRVYDNKEQPIKETSTRLLDTSEDEELKKSNDYCIHKAKAENILTSCPYDNWTIVRPATTFSTMRLQLVTLELVNAVGRALRGKKVVLPVQAKNKPATLCWAGDVAKLIGNLLFNEKAKRETYNVCSSEWQTWERIAEYYHELVGLEAVWVDKEDYLKIIHPDVPMGVRWQLEYARLFSRITDNSKVLMATGIKQEDLISMRDGLALEINNIPKDYEFTDTEIGVRMDEYLAKHNL